VMIVFLGCVALTGVLARLPLAKALTGRSRTTWSSWVSRRPGVGRGRDPEQTEPGASPLQIDSPVPAA
jgi:hypothetical protein